MKFCTVSDKKYLLKGLAMAKSLKMKEGDMLYWLCIDRETFDILSKAHSFMRITPIYAEDLCKQDPELEAAKKNPASLYGDQYSQFCWTLTPYFVDYVLRNYLSQGEGLWYVDADIYFLNSNPRLSGLGDPKYQRSIVLHSHRNSSPTEYVPKENNNGYINVGVVGILKDELGIKFADWWKNVMLNPNNIYAKEYGTCGDQKYLDAALEIFKRENILIWDDHPDNKAAHGAPWNAGRYTYLGGDQVIYKPSGRAETMLFWHFSHFNADFDNTVSWSSNNNKEWYPETVDPMVQKWYQEYFEKQRTLLYEVREIAPDFEP